MNRFRWGLGAAIILALGLCWTARDPSSEPLWRLAFVSLYVVAVTLWVWAIRCWRPTVRQVVVAAIALRVAVFPLLPTLSDDGYRYIWDGVIQIESGVSPYAHVPSDPALRDEQDSVIYERMNSPDYYSVYPPISQAVFVASATVYGVFGWKGSWYVLKLILVVLEIAAIVLLARAVAPRLVALYALHPLVVLEVAGQGHTEGVVVFGIALLIWKGSSSLTATSGGVVVATLTKLIPAPLAFIAVRRHGLRAAILMTAMAIASALMFWSPSALSNAGTSLGLFVGTLDQYALPYRALKAVIHPFAPGDAGRLSSLALLLCWGVLVATVIASDDGSRRSALNGLTVIVVGAMIATSTLHPWYFVPVLFVTSVIEEPRFRWALITLASLSSLTYIGYVLDGTDLMTMSLGWGAAAIVYVLVGQRMASRTRSGVATRASIHRAFG